MNSRHPCELGLTQFGFAIWEVQRCISGGEATSRISSSPQMVYNTVMPNTPFLAVFLRPQKSSDQSTSMMYLIAVVLSLSSGPSLILSLFFSPLTISLLIHPSGSHPYQTHSHTPTLRHMVQIHLLLSDSEHSRHFPLTSSVAELSQGTT